jgi:hypothetical protein
MRRALSVEEKLNFGTVKPPSSNGTSDFFINGFLFAFPSLPPLTEILPEFGFMTAEGSFEKFGLLTDGGRSCRDTRGGPLMCSSRSVSFSESES